MEFKFCILKNPNEDSCRSDCYYSLEEFLLDVVKLPHQFSYTFLVMIANSVYRYEYFSGYTLEDISSSLYEFIVFYRKIKEGIL